MKSQSTERAFSIDYISYMYAHVQVHKVVFNNNNMQ